MSEISYHFTASVEKAIADKRAELIRYRKAGLLTSEQVRVMHESFLARHLYGARQEDNPDRSIGVTCSDCEMVRIMPASVKFFQCSCSPYVDRMTALCRVPLS